MSDWNAERIAELRGLAEVVRGYVERGAPIGVFRDAERALDAALSAGAVLSLLDELVSARDAFEDVMGALAKALDGDDSYAERPAELVWRLRDQRDEAQEAERSKNAEYQLASERVAECAAELESTRAALAEAVTTIHDLRAREVPR